MLKRVGVVKTRAGHPSVATVPPHSSHRAASRRSSGLAIAMSTTTSVAVPSRPAAMPVADQPTAVPPPGRVVEMVLITVPQVADQWPAPVPLLADAVVVMAVVTAVEPPAAVTPVPPAPHLAAMEPELAVPHLAGTGMVAELELAVPLLVGTGMEPATAVLLLVELASAAESATTAAPVETPVLLVADALAEMVVATPVERPAAATPVQTALAEQETAAAHPRVATMPATSLS